MIVPAFVDTTYSGDLLLNPVGANQDGSPICATGSGQDKYKYAGLRKHERESTQTLTNIIAYYNGPTGQTITVDPPGGTTALLQYSPERWAGIDCSGLAHRSINSADRLSIPGASSGLDDLGEGQCTIGSTGCLPCGSQNYMPIYAQKIVEMGAPPRTLKPMMERVRKGDLVTYKGHVSLVHSDRPICDNQANCTYEIIHAYGGDTYARTNPQTQRRGRPEFSRKVIVTGNDITASPTGFGRIKLWD